MTNRALNGLSRLLARLQASDRIAVAAFLLSTLLVCVGVGLSVDQALSGPKILGTLGFSTEITPCTYDKRRLQCTLPICIWNNGQKEGTIVDLQLYMEAKYQDVDYPIHLVPLNRQALYLRYDKVIKEKGAYNISANMKYKESESFAAIRLGPGEVKTDRILFLSIDSNDANDLISAIHGEPKEEQEPKEQGAEKREAEEQEKKRDPIWDSINIAKHLDSIKLSLAVKFNYSSQWVTLDSERMYDTLTGGVNTYHLVNQRNGLDFEDLRPAERFPSTLRTTGIRAIAFIAGFFVFLVLMAALGYMLWAPDPSKTDTSLPRESQ